MGFSAPSCVGMSLTNTLLHKNDYFSFTIFSFLGLPVFKRKKDTSRQVLYHEMFHSYYLSSFPAAFLIFTLYPCFRLSSTSSDSDNRCSSIWYPIRWNNAPHSYLFIELQVSDSLCPKMFSIHYCWGPLPIPPLLSILFQITPPTLRTLSAHLRTSTAAYYLAKNNILNLPTSRGEEKSSVPTLGLPKNINIDSKTFVWGCRSAPEQVRTEIVKYDHCSQIKIHVSTADTHQIPIKLEKKRFLHEISHSFPARFLPILRFH